MRAPHLSRVSLGALTGVRPPGWAAGGGRRAPDAAAALGLQRLGAPLDLASLLVHLAVDERPRGADLGIPGRVGAGGRVDAGPPHLILPALAAPRPPAVAIAR